MKAVLIIAPVGYQDHEYGETKKVLEVAGVKVTTASKQTGTCTGKLGGSTTATVSLAELDVSDYDAVVFIGGPGAPIYNSDVQAHLTAQEAVNRKKVLAAICIAPRILAHAGVLEGKKATVWNGDGRQEKILKDNGALYTGDKVTIDGLLVTANGPEAATSFAQKIIKLLQLPTR